MITYELAKKLKEAGLPQRSDYGYRGYKIISYHRDGRDEDDVSIPTLSELIEACEGKFHCLASENGTYAAFSHFEDESFAQSSPSYPSPEEAVANLWLALNEKHE